LLPARLDPSCAPPGRQRVLFLVPAERGLPTYTVADIDGYERVTTSAHGVAMSVTRRLVIEQGQTWVRSSDDATARIAANGVDSDDPDRPWIRTLTAHMEPTP
jgi:hypothetical protein